jgi:hypothetical protein
MSERGGGILLILWERNQTPHDLREGEVPPSVLGVSKPSVMKTSI